MARCGKCGSVYCNGACNAGGGYGGRKFRIIIAMLLAVGMLSGCYVRTNLPEGSYKVKHDVECKPNHERISFAQKGAYGGKVWYCVPFR